MQRVVPSNTGPVETGMNLYQKAIDATRSLVDYETERLEQTVSESSNDIEKSAAQNRLNVLNRALLDLQFFIRSIGSGR